MLFFICVFSSMTFATPEVYDLAHLLNGIDNVVTPNQLTRSLADPVATLVAIAIDEDRPMYVRGRAATLLGRFGDTRARDTLLQLAVHADPRLRLKAMKGIKNLLVYSPAFTHDATLADALTLRLDDSDVAVRLHAVSGLAQFPSAKSLLAARMNSEPSNKVRDFIGALLSH